MLDRFILYIPFFIYVSYRYIKLGNKKIEGQGACIYAATGSLLQSYISLRLEKNNVAYRNLYLFITHVRSEADLFGSFLKNKDLSHPSLAGLLSFVISAIATKQFNAVFTKAGYTDVTKTCTPMLLILNCNCDNRSGICGSMLYEACVW